MRLEPLLSIEANRKLDGRTTFQGLNISIENKPGSVRRGQAANGKKWKTKMIYPYGYIRLTEGADGDHVDCYIGPNANAKYAFIVHQNNPLTGRYDEDKVMLGFNSEGQAKTAYLAHYDDPKFFGKIEKVAMEDFKSKVLGSRA